MSVDQRWKQANIYLNWINYLVISRGVWDLHLKQYFKIDQNFPQEQGNHLFFNQAEFVEYNTLFD